MSDDRGTAGFKGVLDVALGNDEGGGFAGPLEVDFDTGLDVVADIFEVEDGSFLTVDGVGVTASGGFSAVTTAVGGSTSNSSGLAGISFLQFSRNADGSSLI